MRLVIMMNFLNVLRQLSGPTVAVVIRLRHDLGSGTVAGEREMSQMTYDECLRKHLDKERIFRRRDTSGARGSVENAISFS